MARWKIKCTVPGVYGVYKALGPWPLYNWSNRPYTTFYDYGYRDNKPTALERAREWIKSGKADAYAKELREAYVKRQKKEADQGVGYEEII